MIYLILILIQYFLYLNGTIQFILINIFTIVKVLDMTNYIVILYMALQN